ncbi:N-acetylmuramoyl-L-alanine amidase, partial [Streptomyces sp. NPDC048551]|uniref:N-acetylmuramoyl-L-alanine amidase n=1 Tax=Streptomyces sp. NPDC048551 TaxID=3155758 RepID=UPI0034328FCC
MSTGTQFYPGASTAYRYDGTYEGLMQEVNCCVTHTTEGTTLPDYDGGAMAPNTTLLPDIARQQLRAYAHFPADMSARALVDNSATAVRTNRNNAHQVELVGSCDPKRRTSWGSLRAGIDYIYWPEAPEWALREYARYIAWLNTEHGVPLTLTPHAWLPYPDSYGSTHGQRMTLDEWAAFRGHCGHQHVPDGNDHGDPGNMRMDLVVQYAKELVSGGGNSGGARRPGPHPVPHRGPPQ